MTSTSTYFRRVGNRELIFTKILKIISQDRVIQEQQEDQIGHVERLKMSYEAREVSKTPDIRLPGMGHLGFEVIL